jgi:hypothetical protein
MFCVLTIASILAVSGALMPATVSAVQPERLGQQSFLKRTVYGDGQLWVLSDAGQLSAIREGNDVSVRESLPEPALDLCAQNDRPVIATCSKNPCDKWTLRRKAEGQWIIEATIPTEHDRLVAMNCSEKAIMLLTSRRLIDVTGNSQASTALSDELPPSLVASTLVTTGSVFVGLNRGEWGGGLRRIDRRTGKITTIEKNETGALCGGPLNTNCDPVHGIAIIPWKPTCAVAAVGLIHFLSHGRLVEVCSDGVRVLYEKPYERSELGSGRGTNFNSVAFFGIANVGKSLWAVGMDGLYDIKEETVQSRSMPQYKEVEGIFVSFDLPEFVLVLTNINQRLSVSGSSPILVPRRPSHAYEK